MTSSEFGRHTVHGIGSAIVAVLLAVTCQAQPQSIQTVSTRAVADATETAVNTWGAMPNANLKSLGIDAPTSDGMALDGGLALFWLSMQDAADIANGKFLEDVALDNNSEVMFAILNRDRQGTGILGFSRAGREWQQDRLGQPALARALINVRTDDAKRTGTDPKSYFAVEIPAVRKIYLGRGEREKAMLIPLENDLKVKVSRGEAMPVQTVMKNLVTAYPTVPKG